MTEVIVTLWRECENPECGFRAEIARGTIEQYEAGELAEQARARASSFQRVGGKEYCSACMTNSRFRERLKT